MKLDKLIKIIDLYASGQPYYNTGNNFFSVYANDFSACVDCYNHSLDLTQIFIEMIFVVRNDDKSYRLSIQKDDDKISFVLELRLENNLISKLPFNRIYDSEICNSIINMIENCFSNEIAYFENNSEFHKIGNMIEKNDMVLLHSTSIDRISSIIKRGLIFDNLNINETVTICDKSKNFRANYQSFIYYYPLNPPRTPQERVNTIIVIPREFLLEKRNDEMALIIEETLCRDDEKFKSSDWKEQDEKNNSTMVIKKRIPSRFIYGFFNPINREFILNPNHLYNCQKENEEPNKGKEF